MAAEAVLQDGLGGESVPRAWWVILRGRRISRFVRHYAAGKHFDTELPSLRPGRFCTPPSKAREDLPLHPFYVGVGLVIAPSAADVTRAAYLANTPVG